MYPIVSLFDTCADPDITTADALGQDWLDNILQRDTPEIQGASDAKIVGSGTLILHIRMGQLCSRVTFGFVDKLVVSCYCK